MAIRETLITGFGLVLLLAGTGTGEDPRVRWRGADHSVSALPADLPAPAQLALEAWYPFARSNGFRLDLEDSGRLLLLSPSGSSSHERLMELAGRTILLFDEKLPTPAERIESSDKPPPGAKPKTTPPPERTDEPLPEDPEGDEPHPWDDVPWPEAAAEKDPVEEYTYYTWGAGGVPPDTETIVFLAVPRQTDYERALEFLALNHEYLAPWAEEAREQNGFALQQPLVGASFLFAAPGVEEWNPENELVNRLAQLLMLRRFGQQPNWLVYGWAWTAEITLLESVYCFPYRDEFVWATEHTAWPDMLHELFERRAAKPLRAEEFVGWPHGTYLDTEAKLSWGVIDYLVRQQNENLPGLLEALRAYRDEHDREVVDGLTWQRKRDYVIPVEEQERLLGEHLGKNVWRDLTRWFRKAPEQR